jgi:hypothetical protein
MGIFAKIEGTVENTFAIGANSTGPRYMLSSSGSTAQLRNAGDSDYVPLRIKDDAADTDSAMTRGAISALVGGNDSVKWIQVPFSFAGGGTTDAVSTASMPAASFILEARVLLSAPYDVGSNTIAVGYTGAGSSELFTTTEVALDTGIATAGDVTSQQYVEVLPGGGPYNVHVRVVEGGVPTAGNGIVLVGYVEAPLG